MNKFLINLLISVSLVFSGTAYAATSTTNLCTEKGDTVLAFFNGVSNTTQDADISLWEIRRVVGTKADDGSTIKYEKLYNYTNGFEDFVETFEQRLQEQQALGGRYELFFQIFTGNGTFVNTITKGIASLFGWVDQTAQVLQAKVIRDLTTLFGNPPTINNYEEHRTRIDTWVLEGKKLLFIPHSQGNLFANNAYNYSLNKLNKNNVKVVHVAPASPIVNGPHILADQDLVINGLRLVGTVPANTHSIPIYNIFGNNNGRDKLGHGLTETYLNPAFPMLNAFKQHVKTALNTLVKPTAQGNIGFFSVTLTWDGVGDLDLHTYEPNGQHVYYNNKVGTSGYLDIDNRDGYGPEHYFARCDASKLQTGTYDIKFANYSGAVGKNATVQIATDREGVLATKSIIVGNATGQNPAINAFKVNITKNQQTSQYNVTVN